MLLDVLANDTDVENNALTITAVSTPSQGSVVITGNKLSFTAPQNSSGASTFTYTISDGNGGVATGNVNLSLICVDTDGDGYCASLDCDNSNVLINPATIRYLDSDVDGYSDGTTQIQCSDP